MTSTDKVDQSKGITSLGGKFNFGPGKLDGLFTLSCDKDLTDISVLLYKTDGTSKASF